jgi:hypothetical protein
MADCERGVNGVLWDGNEADRAASRSAGGTAPEALCLRPLSSAWPASGVSPTADHPLVEMAAGERVPDVPAKHVRNGSGPRPLAPEAWLGISTPWAGMLGCVKCPVTLAAAHRTAGLAMVRLPMSARVRPATQSRLYPRSRRASGPARGESWRAQRELSAGGTQHERCGRAHLGLASPPVASPPLPKASQQAQQAAAARHSSSGPHAVRGPVACPSVATG